MKHLSSFYSKDFYAGQADGSYRSASVVLRMLYEYYKPNSVIDIGCGRGAWLCAAEQLGATTLKGLDGAWVPTEDLLSKNVEFDEVDFSRELPAVEKKYDLCISLEVAEHLSSDLSEEFVALLCHASPVVLFSAAIRGQGGTHHLNEQPQSYWARLFEAQGYDCFDIFRGKLWDDSTIEWWYRQNMLLYVDRNNELAKGELLENGSSVFDVVHPVAYENLIHLIQRPTLRFSLGCIKRWGQSWLRAKMKVRS